MLKRKNKKGFTLAELLIVVAIIAVLVAIAVPIFVSALDKAEKSVLQSDLRSLKALAVTEILTNDDAYAAGKDAGVWYAKGDVDKDGKITLNEIMATGTETNLEGSKLPDKTDDGGYTDLIVKIVKSELKSGGVTVTPKAG